MQVGLKIIDCVVENSMEVKSHACGVERMYLSPRPRDHDRVPRRWGLKEADPYRHLSDNQKRPTKVGVEK